MTFNSLDMIALEALIDQAEIDAEIEPEGAYVPVYDFIYSLITDTSGSNDIPNVGVDPSVWLWVRGARGQPPI